MVDVLNMCSKRSATYAAIAALAYKKSRRICIYEELYCSIYITNMPAETIIATPNAWIQLQHISRCVIV